MKAFTRSNIFQTILLLLYFTQQIKKVQCDYFTAIVNLRSLIKVEKEFSSFIDEYLNSEENRLQQIQKMAMKLSSEAPQIDDMKSILFNPINIFHLIKRMNSHLPNLYKKMKRTTMAEILKLYSVNGQSFQFPEDSELTGVSVALGRLAYTYDLNVSSLADGYISPNLNATTKLSANDCLEVGLHLGFKHMYLKAIPWLVEYLVRENRQQNDITDEIFHALEYLGNATYLVNNDTMKEEVEHNLYKLDGDIAGEYYSTYKKAFDTMKNYIEMNKIEFYDHSVETFDPFYPSLGKFNQLCRGERLLDSKQAAKLKCYYSTNKSPYLIVQPTKVEDIHHKPWLAVFHDIMTDYEIEIVKNLSTPKLKRAEVGVGKYEVADFRISKSSWLKDSVHPVVASISKRLREITGLDVLLASELLQVVNYGIGGFYDTHLDFDETLGKGNSSKFYMKGNRLATVLIYMSDVIAGGGTAFPKLNISVQPTKGSAAFWYNLQKTGEGEFLTEHGGCPVLAGSKWVCNKWILEHHQEFRKPCGLTEQDIYLK